MTRLNRQGAKNAKEGVSLLGVLGVLAVLAVPSLSACGAGSVGKAIRPNELKASEALGEGKCSTVKSGGEPLVVDLAAHERADVEEAMSGGIAVVSWSCTSLVLLRDCHARGSYAFHGLSPQEYTVKLDDADEIKANLPTFGAAIALKLESDMARGATLDLAVSMIGKRRTTVSELRPTDLEGSCSGATHFVRGAYLGAFALATGTKGQARAAIEIFKAGLSADSSSAKLAQARDGDADACRSFDPSATAPPARCSSLVRLELAPLAAPHSAEVAGNAAGKGAPELSLGGDACPDGLVLVEQKCARPTDRAYLCRGDQPIECSEQCGKGHARSCAVLGSLYARGAGVPKDAAQAQSYLGKACDKGDPLGCADLGVLTERGDGASADPIRAALLYGKACDGGEPSGCYDLGLMYEVGHGAGVDLKRAASLYTRGCDGGDGLACSNLGVLVEQGKAGGSGDLAAARALYQRACDGGDGSGCFNLAVAAKNAEGWPPSSILALFEKACERGTPNGCFNAGTYYDSGTGTAKDEQKAAELFGKACDGGASLGCLNLGAALEDLNQVDRARAAFERGCSLKVDQACVGLGAMLEEGRGGPIDVAKAAKLYEDACAHGSADGCVSAGALAESGKTQPKDRAKAAKLYAKGCDAQTDDGHRQEACDASTRVGGKR